MSPSLVAKYLAAGQEVAQHAALTPDGFRFAAGITPRDWTEETLEQIRRFYGRFTAEGPGGGTRVNLQGIVFDTNGGGRLPVASYLRATVAERPALEAGTTTIAAVAQSRNLSPRYLQTLWDQLHQPTPSVILRQVQDRWRTTQGDDVAALAGEIAAWQGALWEFHSVGHLGRLNGPPGWMTPTDPLAAAQPVRLRLPSSPDGAAVTVSLVAGDAGDGATGDLVVWHQPRLVAPGRPDLLLRDLRPYAAALEARRGQLLGATAALLDAAAAVAASNPRLTVADAAQPSHLDPDALRAWLDLLGVVPADPTVTLDHLDQPVRGAGGNSSIQGWARDGLPQLVVNTADQPAHVPGFVPPRGVAVHPSPTARAAVAWQSPEALTVRVRATVTHAHHACGNGVTWTLDRRHGSERHRLASGTAHGPTPAQVEPSIPVAILPGDLLTLAIGARDGNHGCDLTDIALTITEEGGPARRWDLASDTVADIGAGNPHADRLGHPGTWHFFTEPDTESPPTPVPAGSLLARWQAATDPDDRHRLALALERWLLGADPATGADPAALRANLRSIRGPLLGGLLRARPIDLAHLAASDQPSAAADAVGLDPARFGVVPGQPGAVDPASLVVAAPAVVTVRVPAELADGAELVATATLLGGPGDEGSVQVAAVVGTPTVAPGLHPGASHVTRGGGDLDHLQRHDHQRRARRDPPRLAGRGPPSRRVRRLPRSVPRRALLRADRPGG